MRGRVLVMVAAACLGVGLVAPAASADHYPTSKEFIGECVFNGVVEPYVEFRGRGTCYGTLNGVAVTKMWADAYAVAEGITVPEGPVLQQGSGWIRFEDSLSTEISFTFDQVGSTINFHGHTSGEATGEIVLSPAEPGTTTRDARVTANTITPLRG
ncbi:MAG: hypothetical protein ACRDTU_15185 [Micromonosporaceae bacterium]